MKVRLFAMLAVILLIAGTVTIVVDSRLTRRALRDQIDARLAASASVVRSVYERRLAAATGDVRTVALSVASLEHDGVIPTPRLIALLSAAAQTGLLDVLLVMDDEGRLIAGVGKRIEFDGPQGSLQARNLLLRTVEGDWVQAVLVPVLSEGTPRWVVGGFLFGDALAFEMRRIVHDDVLLVVGEEIVGTTLAGSVSRIPGRFREGSEPATEIIEVDEEEAFARSAATVDPGESARIGVVVTDPLASLSASLLRVRLIAGAVLIGIAALLGWLVFSYVTRPLGVVHRMAARIAEGKLDVAEGVPRTGEIGALARSLERIARTVDELRRHDQERTTFVAQAAHELRNPLTTIVGLAETLATHRDAMKPEDAERCLEALARGCDRLGRLANSLLDLAQVERGRLVLSKAPLDVAAAAQAAMETVPPPPGKSVIVDVPPALQVDADAVRLHEVLVNLLANAYRYGGTAITIGAEPHDEDRVLAWVADDGPGVPEGRMHTLFEPFERGLVQGAEPGSGLGLAIVRGIIEAHGGEIWYEPGVPGARFALTLPRPVRSQVGVRHDDVQHHP